VAKEGIKKTLEEIPIPFRDLKNVVEELRFEDEPTRLRCRGWLVLKSKQFLRANIIFPGSDIDCRLSIRARSGNIVLVPAVFSMFFSIYVWVRVSLPCSIWYLRIRFPGFDRGVRVGGGEGIPCETNCRECSSFRLGVCKSMILASLRVFRT